MPTAGSCPRRPRQGQRRRPAATKLDLGYVTPETVAAAVVFPRRVLTAPEMEMLPIEVLSALGKKELGIDPVEIEQAILIAEPPQAGPPGAAIVLHMASPLGSGKILMPLQQRTTEAELQGKTYRKGRTPMDPSIFLADDRTLIVGTDDLLRKMLANRANPKEGKMSRMLGRVTQPPDLLAARARRAASAADCGAAGDGPHSAALGWGRESAGTGELRGGHGEPARRRRTCR